MSGGSPPSGSRLQPLSGDDDMEDGPTLEALQALEEMDGVLDDDDQDDYEDDDDDDEDEDGEYEDGEDDDEDAEYEDAEEDIEAGALIEELLAEADEEIDDDEQEEGEAADEEAAAAPDTAAQGQAAEGGARRTLTITRNELLQLLARNGAIRLLRGFPNTGDDEEEEMIRRPRRARRVAVPYPDVPSLAGQELMESGTFGTNERRDGRYERTDRKKKLAARIMRRELGIDSPGKQRTHNRIASQGLIPSSNADTIINYDRRCYSGQFSEDGNFFFSCSQDFRVRMYDTSNPYSWKHYRTVTYPGGQWTITDASLSPDNKFLAYSSMRSMVCLAHTDREQDSEPYLLEFSDMGRRTGMHHNSRNHFSVYSLRFSGDGTEIVAGTGDNSVYVYDLETRQSVLRIPGHDDDVNAVCYGDKSSPHILYSGSDDTTIKVWDRRSLSDKREAGVFLGHTEGVTYVDSKGDGRYVLSNGKDQTMKLWDLRKMVSTEKAERIDPSDHSTGFDYRMDDYREPYQPHPHDCSIVTFRGHRVLKTLIRCHFSPPGSTDSRYVYTGSEDGKVWIYNMDATVAGKIDVEKATLNTRPRGGEDPGYFYFDEGRGQARWKTCIRDAAWHPNAPVIAATAWNGYGMVHGTCTVHTWNDGLDEDEAEPRMGQRVGPDLKADRRYYELPTEEEAATARTRRSRMRRAAAEEDD